MLQNVLEGICKFYTNGCYLECEPTNRTFWLTKTIRELPILFVTFIQVNPTKVFWYLHWIKKRNQKYFPVTWSLKNVFESVCLLWSDSSKKCKWNEAVYGTFSKIGVALTNIHVAKISLHAMDKDYFTGVRIRLCSLSNDICKNHSRQKNESVARRRQRKGLRPVCVVSESWSDQSTTWLVWYVSKPKS